MRPPHLHGATCSILPGTEGGICPRLHPRWEPVGRRGLQGPGPAYLQAVADPPVEDGEVGVQGQQHSREVHLLVDADDRNHFQVEGLQGGCRGHTKVRGQRASGHRPCHRLLLVTVPINLITTTNTSTTILTTSTTISPTRNTTTIIATITHHHHRHHQPRCCTEHRGCGLQPRLPASPPLGSLCFLKERSLPQGVALDQAGAMGSPVTWTNSTASSCPTTFSALTDTR